jgi:hypothetical protein
MLTNMTADQKLVPSFMSLLELSLAPWNLPSGGHSEGHGKRLQTGLPDSSEHQILEGGMVSRQAPKGQQSPAPSEGVGPKHPSVLAL